MSFRTDHFSQIFLYLSSASLTAASGLSAPVAAWANMVFSTQVLYPSSIAAVEYPGKPTFVAQSTESPSTAYLSGGSPLASLATICLRSGTCFGQQGKL